MSRFAATVLARRCRTLCSLRSRHRGARPRLRSSAVVTAFFVALYAQPAESLLVASADPEAPASAEGRWEDRPLVELLEALAENGLRLLWGENLVTDELRVLDEPTGASGREILDEVLLPHGLAVDDRIPDVLSVVRGEPGPLVGRVVAGDTGAPVVGAELLVDGRLRRETSGADGAFQIRDVAAGRRELTVRSPGYVVDERWVTVMPGGGATVEVELVPAPVTLGEIVVTPGSYRLLDEEPGSGLSWSRDDVTRLPHLSDDLFRAIARVPGMAAGDFSADFHVRGGEREEVLVRIDGLRVYEPYHLKDFQNVFSIFDSNATGEVEVMTGGFPAEFGDRMSGVVDIVSTAPGERVDVFGVSFEKLHFLSGGPIDGGAGHWLVSARRGYLDFVLDAVEDDDETFDFQPRYGDAFAKGQWSLGDSATASLSVLGAFDDVRFEDSEGDDAVSEADRDLVEASYGNAYVWGRLYGVATPKVSYSAVASYGAFTRDRAGFSSANLSDVPGGDVADRTVVDDERETRVAEARAEGRVAPSDRQGLGGGLEVRSLRSDYDYVFANTVTDPVFAPNGVITVRELRLRESGWSYGAWASDRIRLGSRTTLELGGRWDRQTWTDEAQWSPRLNVATRLSERSELRVSWGHFHQAQGIEELQVTDGVTTYFPAQRNEQAVVAVDRRLGERTRVSLQVYTKDLTRVRPRFENLFEPVDIFPEGQSDRVRVAPERARARGAEVLGEWRGDRISVWAHYAFSEAEDRIDGAWVPRSWDQRHALSWSTNLAAGRRWNVNLAGVHHTGWPTTEATLTQADDGTLAIVLGPRNGERFPSYHRLDVRASRTYDLRRGELSLFVEVTNLLDRDNVRSVSDFNVDFGSQPPRLESEEETWLPRIPSFGLTWRF